MAEPDSNDHTVPSADHSCAEGNAQGRIEYTLPSKQRPITAVGKSLEGAILGEKFKVLERIGAGGMSEVYKAENTILQKLVAIKVLNTQQELEAIERFQQEAKAISSLDHRNIVKVYVFGSHENDRLYLAMDFLEGKSLADILLEETRITWRRVIHYAIQICDGLEQAHSRGVIHRDLKPSNIIITSEQDNHEVVKIVDFGIAKLTEESGKEVKNLTQLGNTCGSPPYMSPEQCMGERTDARTDVYSFGIMLYELLSGQRPITGRTALELMENHLHQAPEFFERVCPATHIPDSLEAIVRKCLEKDCRDRYQSMADVRGALKLVGSSSDEEAELEATNQRAFGSAKDIEITQRKKNSIRGVVGVAAILIATLFCVRLMPQQTSADRLEKDIAAIKVNDTTGLQNMFQRLAEIMAAGVKDRQQVADCVRLLKHKVDSLPPSFGRYEFQIQIVNFYRALGKAADAQSLRNKTIASLEGLINEQMKTGKRNYEELESASKQLLELCKDDPNQQDRRLGTYCTLAKIYFDENKIAESEEAEKAAMAIVNSDSRKGDLNFNPLSKILVLQELAGFYIRAQKLHDAENILLYELQLCKKFSNLRASGWDPKSLSKIISSQLIHYYLSEGKKDEAALAADLCKDIQSSEN
ncbi:MAG: serine/threonine protein kinase [Candidatus Obscuribacterales bacterium]|jgi:serine/threonine protein kinase|nr:serine/threonine protein kinase [Candidatus Obscuribacterales bacterium]